MPAGIGICAALIFGSIVVASTFAGCIAPIDPLEQRIETRLSPPDRNNIIGTDGFGRDVLSRTLFGSRNTLIVGILSVLVAAAIGVPTGALSAYIGGRIDLAVDRITDVFLGFPYLVLAIVVIVALTPSPVTTTGAIALVLAPRIARLTRAKVLEVKSERYVAAAIAIGAGSPTILVRHILPNCMGPILVQISGYFGTSIGIETALSYLGLGVPPPFPSLGRMLQEGTRLYLEAAPWLTIIPGAVIAVMIICVTLLADYGMDKYKSRFSVVG